MKPKPLAKKSTHPLRKLTFIGLTLLLNFFAAPSFSAPTKTKPHTTNSHANKDIKVIKNLLPEYVTIQKALAYDDLSKTTQAAKKFLDSHKKWNSKLLKGIKDDLSEISVAKNIVEARAGFKKLSQPFLEALKKDTLNGYEVVYCPMAKASWVQAKGEILNPYYGAEMRECGEKVLPLHK